MTASDLRIGALGAARITPMALIRPARDTAGVSVTDVVARDRGRAEKFARKHGIEKVHDDGRGGEDHARCGRGLSGCGDGA